MKRSVWAEAADTNTKVKRQTCQVCDRCRIREQLELHVGQNHRFDRPTAVVEAPYGLSESRTGFHTETIGSAGSGLDEGFTVR